MSMAAGVAPPAGAVRSAAGEGSQRDKEWQTREGGSGGRLGGVGAGRRGTDELWSRSRTRGEETEEGEGNIKLVVT